MLLKFLTEINKVIEIEDLEQRRKSFKEWCDLHLLVISASHQSPPESLDESLAKVDYIEMDLGHQMIDTIVKKKIGERYSYVHVNGDIINGLRIVVIK